MSLFPSSRRVPEQGSLRYHIVTNPSKRLWTTPDIWTDDTLKCIGFVYQPLPSVASPSSPQKLRPEDELQNELDFFYSNPFRSISPHKQMQKIFIASIKQVSRLDQISPLDLQFHRDFARSIYFDGRKVTRVHAPLYVTSVDGIRLAWIDQTWMQKARDTYLRRRRATERRWYEAELRRAERIVMQTGKWPADWRAPGPRDWGVVDPYFVAILIAMGQNSTRRHETSPRGPGTVHLFKPSRGGCDTLDRYTATFEEGFFDRFDKPYENFDAKVIVSLRRVQLRDPKDILDSVYTALTERITEHPKQGGVSVKEEEEEERLECLE